MTTKHHIDKALRLLKHSNIQWQKHLMGPVSQEMLDQAVKELEKAKNMARIRSTTPATG